MARVLGLPLPDQNTWWLCSASHLDASKNLIRDHQRYLVEKSPSSLYPQFLWCPNLFGPHIVLLFSKENSYLLFFTYSKTICRLNNLQTFWCNPYLCSRYPSMRLHFRERMCLVTACMYAHLQSRRNWNFDLIGFKSILVFSPESTRSVRQWGKLILTRCWFWCCPWIFI